MASLTMRHPVAWILSLTASLAAGCGAAAMPAEPASNPSQSTESLPPAAAQEDASTPATVPASAEAITGEALVGEWAEFWAVAGRAETQRYQFAADGSYVWRPPSAQEQEQASRTGRWEIDGDSLVLHGEGAAQAERLALGGCPPNEEARQLDRNYRCLSIGGRAFWRRTTH